MTAPLAIVLGGVDVTAKVDFQSIVMQLAGSQETGSCEFDIVDEGLTVTATAESTLTVTDVGSATVLFGGFTRSPRTVLTAVGRIIHITAYDYNGLLDRSIVVSDSRTAGESDSDRLAYLMGIYGTQFSSDYTQIATLNASLPAQRFIAITLRQAIERVLGQASYKASYYVDATGRLVTYDRTVVTAAPFDIRIGTPGAGELSPDDWTHDRDTDNLANAIYVVGATAAGSGWFTDTTSISAYGRRERFYNAPDSDTSAKASQVGLAVLGDQKDPVPRAIFTTQSPNDGWRIGQSTTVTSTQDNLSGVSLRIAKVTTHYLNGNGDREYAIELGAPQATLSALLGATHGGGGGFPWHSPGGSGNWGSVTASAGGVSSSGHCCAPFDCEPIDYNLFSDLSAPFMACIVDEDVDGEECTSSDASGNTMRLYAGATYRVDYTVFHAPTSSGDYIARLTSVTPGAGIDIFHGTEANMGAVVLGSNPAHPLASVTFTSTDTCDVIAALDCNPPAGNSNDGSSISAQLVYLAGSDPRFEDLALDSPCANGSPSPGQEVHDGTSTGDGSTTTYTTANGFPYLAGSWSIFVNGVDWSRQVTDTDPAAGAYALAYPFPLGSTVVRKYVAA